MPDREIIVDFIKENTQCDIFYNIQQELIDAILQIVPFINHYEEEDCKLKFKISVGINTTIENLEGRFHVLHRYMYDSDDSYKIRSIKIVNMIKKVAIFCTADADIFLVQNEDVIECGIYFTDLEKTGSSEATLLNNNFVIFESILQSKILIRGKSNSKILCFDLDINDNLDSLIKQSDSSMLNATICRTWKGIFEKVKKTVHGTICLIVNDSWKSDSDDNFTDSINELNISLSRDEKITSDSFQNFDNKIGMFLSMLNFDGITIIDTEENIRAYNVFCKIPESCNTLTGGARHRAYSYLKNLPPEKCSNYVALYFQSQEGSIKFYDFTNSHKDETTYFDPLIMNGGTNNPFFKTVKSIIKSRTLEENESSIDDFNDYINYIQINDLTNDLLIAHNGIDNFYNEPEPARKLFETLSTSDYMNTIFKYPFISKNIINVVMCCIIGNSYGYSRAAQDSLVAILSLFDYNCWYYYFSKKEYIDHDLLWELSTEKLYNRWKDTIQSIIEKFPHLNETKINEYKFEDFRYMNRALTYLENATS